MSNRRCSAICSILHFPKIRFSGSRMGGDTGLRKGNKGWVEKVRGFEWKISPGFGNSGKVFGY